MITPKKETVQGVTDYLQEQVTGLAEDVVFLGDGLTMLGEKITTLEQAQVTDAENLSDVLDVLECLQKANKAMLEVIIEQDEEIKTMKQDLKISNSTWRKCIAVIFIWVLVLTGRMCYNVFF